MNTKNNIKEVSRLLFNERGVMNVTMRDVATAMNKSYGNITYHYSTKSDVISSLFEDMNMELSYLQTSTDYSNLFDYFLEVPNRNYDITLKYLFFTIDYNELKRNYLDFFIKVNLLNDKRKRKWKKLLIALRNHNYLKEQLTNADLDYIIFLSVSVRITYFQLSEMKSYSKEEYVSNVNLMVKPYLSNKGLTAFNHRSHKI